MSRLGIDGLLLLTGLAISGIEIDPKPPYNQGLNDNNNKGLVYGCGKPVVDADTGRGTGIILPAVWLDSACYVRSGSDVGPAKGSS